MEYSVEWTDDPEPSELHHWGNIEWESLLDTTTDRAEEIATAQSTIQALYDSGAPFFRKTDMRDLRDQLTRARTGENVHVRDLDGKIVEIEVETGKILFPGADPDTERVMYVLPCMPLEGEQGLTIRSTAPYIQYIPFEDLVVFHQGYNKFCPRLAYCNMRVRYRTAKRRKASQEFVLPRPRPYDVVKRYFDNIQCQWNKDEACARFKSIIEPALSRCNNVVGFGLGEFSQKLRWTKGSVYQHALLLSLRDSLTSYHADDKIMCYSQDPAYTVNDQRLLNEYGVTAVDDPEGALQVDDSSIVLSCGPNAPIKEIIAEIAQPALIIWCKEHRWEDLPLL